MPLYITIILFGIGAFVATFCGGSFALRFKDKLHLILGFSAGAVIGVAFFDLLPEAIKLGGGTYGVSTITGIAALGLLVYMVIDRFVSLHSHHEENCENEHHVHVRENSEALSAARGKLGAGSLSIHSFLDGAAIGLAFHVSAAVGLIVAVAVLVHDFSDGINTVNLVLKNGGEQKQAFRWLIVDAIAPVVGIIATSFFVLPEQVLGLILALFSGFFLYIGAADLLPESHHRHPTFWTTFATILGIAVLFVAIKIAG